MNSERREHDMTKLPAVERREKRERGLKKLPDGRWRYSWYFEGQQHRRIAPNKTIAVNSLSKIRADIAEGRFLEKVQAQKIPFTKLCEEFLTWGSKHLRPSTAKHDKGFVARWNSYAGFKGRMIDGITSREIESYRSWLVGKKLSQRTVNYDLGRLQKMYHLAQQWGYFKAQNPAQLVGKFRLDNLRTRFLTWEEEDTLLEVAPEWMRPAIVFSTSTGIRQNELRTLQWKHVNLAGRTVTISAAISKNGKPRIVPLNGRAQEALKGLPRGVGEAPVFAALAGHEVGFLLRNFRKAVTAAGLDWHEVTWHSLRKTFASRLAQAGVNLLHIRDLLGHKTLAMVTRYAFLSGDHLREAVGALDAVSNLHKTCNRPGECLGGASNDSP